MSSGAGMRLSERHPRLDGFDGRWTAIASRLKHLEAPARRRRLIADPLSAVRLTEGMVILVDIVERFGKTIPKAPGTKTGGGKAAG